MVTKHSLKYLPHLYRFVLAKKLMVTKPEEDKYYYINCFVLAKKLMVTKPLSSDSTPRKQFCSSEKINGNKTSNSYYHKFKIL